MAIGVTNNFHQLNKAHQDSFKHNFIDFVKVLFITKKNKIN
jgi:hypothetical protein